MDTRTRKRIFQKKVCEKITGTQLRFLPVEGKVWGFEALKEENVRESVGPVKKDGARFNEQKLLVYIDFETGSENKQNTGTR